MRFLVDAQLPLRLASFLAEQGHDVVHTSQLPEGNRSTDAVIARRADEDGRVVVTKDRDFRDSHLIGASPRRLLVVAVGNTSNSTLIALFERNLDGIVDSFDRADFVELTPTDLILHGF